MTFQCRVLLSIFLFPACASVCGAEKPATWLEIRTPHFIVVSNGNEKLARRAGQQFELIRAVYKNLNPKARVDAGEPVIILAVKDEPSLRGLLPGYWEKKGQAHPSGIFVRGQEKNYVALRLDDQSENPYHVVYHEYIHLLLSLNLRWLPVWLDEGLAEFFANASLDEKQSVHVGRPSAMDISLLRTQQRLPLPVLFSADHDSPQYTEENKATIFYAQSWAVTHYYLVGDRGAHRPQLQNYLTLLQTEMPEPEARLKAFGDLKELNAQLEKYLGLFSFYALRVPTPEAIDVKSFAMRALSPAEVEAAEGDFLLHTQRPVEARTRLTESLRLDPSLPSAHESLGFLCFTENNYAQADQEFARAIELNSQSYLAHYYHAMLSERENPGGGSLKEAEASLRRALDLNNQFAPAYGALASVLGRTRSDLPVALGLARRAVSLEPGVSGYHLVVASLLLQMEKPQEARREAEQVLKDAKSEGDRKAAELLLASVGQFEQYAAARQAAEDRQRAEEAEFKRQLDAAAAEAKTRAEQRKQEDAESAASRESAPKEALAKGAPGWSAGKIIAVDCKAPPNLELTLQGTLKKFRLHAANYFKIEFLTTSWKPPDPFNPCVNLLGRQGAITYRTFPGSPFDGEITSIEVRR